VEVLTLGDNCLDVYLARGMAYPGGGPVNTAVYLARAGIRAAYAGAVGDDPGGRYLVRSLQEEGVETSWVQVFPGRTNLTFVRHVQGDRVFAGTRPGVRSQFRWQALPTSAYTEARVIHTTVDGGVDDLLPVLPDGHGIVTYDFSRKFTPARRPLLPLIDVVFASAAALTERTALAQASKWLADGGRVVVLTMGHRGSLAVDKRGVYRCSAPAVRVLDTLGAGDAFIAGYIQGVLRDESVQVCLERGREVAAEALGCYGAFGHGVSLDAVRLAGEGAAWTRG